MEDFFDVLDEIAKKVAIELQVKLTEGDIARNSHRTENFEAWASATTAYSIVKLLNKEDVARAKKLLEKAVMLDPEYAFAWGALGAVHFAYVALGWSESPAESFKLAVESTDKALKLDETLSCATAVKGRLYGMQRQFEQAIATGNRSIALGPSHDLSYAHLSANMRLAGRFRESITLMKKAMRLNPHYPAWYLYILAISYFHEERYEKAVEAGNRLLQRAQTGEFPPLLTHLGLSAANIELGRKNEATAHAEEVLRINPKFSLEYIAKILHYKNNADTETYLESLRKAGLPNTPPLPLPDKPSIAVLAFDNLSGDPEQEYFSDGITEEIISSLSKTDQLFVIARNSTFVYKGKPVNVKQVARELGVRYVLEGSVRKSEDRVRITAQLIDATTGHHLWSERYDRDLKDIFGLQDEITKQIVMAMEIQLTEGDQARMWGKKYKNLDVYLKRMEALSLWREGAVESHIRHGQVALEIIDMAPDASDGYYTLAWYHWWLAVNGKSPQENLKKAYELAQKAISLDESYALSHALLGSVYLQMRQYEKAIAAGKRSIELDPNGAQVNALLGQTLNYAGRPDEAIVYIKKGFRLNPFPPGWYFYELGNSYLQKGQYEKALTEYKKALQRAPKAAYHHSSLAITYILLDREEEARASAAKALELAPYYSVGLFSKISPQRNKAFVKIVLDAMRKAGFPD
jgi:TolB-like protein/Tfp pilus assembly protein PilF